MNTVITINMNNAALCRLEQQARTGLDGSPMPQRTQTGQPRVDIQNSRTNVTQRPQVLAEPSAPLRPVATPTPV